MDLGYTVTYESKTVNFSKNKQTIFTGHRDSVTKLWMINLSLFNQDNSQANPAVRINSIVELVKYWHACFCFPPKSTFVRALTKFLKVPGIQAHDVQKHLSNVIFTAFGHLDATKKNLKSTKLMIGPKLKPTPQQHNIWMEVHDISSKVHSDLTGALPTTGYDGSKYIAIFYCESKNYIHAVNVTSKKGPTLLNALKTALAFFESHKVDISNIRMDNESSETLKQFLRSTNTELELTPASQHRRNKAERCIRTYKNHFISATAGIDKECPINQWPRFNKQIEITINLLRKSPTKSNISAYEDMFGAPYDFNKCPIAPLGIKVVAHIPPEERASWAQHGIIGFYVGPAPEHYRCYQIYIPTTKGIRISDCLEWFPADILTTNIDAKLAALPLLPPPTPTNGGKQRVPATTTVIN